MKKSFFLFIIIGFLFASSFQTHPQGNLKLLRIDAQDSKGNRYLLFNLDDLNNIISASNLQGVSGNIEFVDLMGNVLAILGNIKDGSIKWDHRTVNGTSLQVKFKKSAFPAILEKVKQKTLKPGFQIQVTEHKKELAGAAEQEYMSKAKYEEKAEIRRNWEITFAEAADLAVLVNHSMMRPPPSPGTEMGKHVSVTVENKGTVAARDFYVELVLSSDLQIPVKPAPYSENFNEDVLLKDGRQKVAAIKPGERLTLDLKGSIKVPPDTLPGRYYLGAVVDPENKIEELDENNNFNAKFVMISMSEPGVLILDIPDVTLIYEPAAFGLGIQYQGVPLSDGSDWRKCRIKPHLHQIKHVGWKGFHWEINSADKTVWKVTGAKFCKTGGVGEEVKTKMEVQGDRVILKLSDTRLEYEPAAGKFRILVYGDQIAHIPSWNVAKLESHIYQFKHALWMSSFWQVNTAKKQVGRITGGHFGTMGGTAAVLDISVQTEVEK